MADSFDMTQNLEPQFDPRSEEDKRRNPMPPGVQYRYRMDRNLFPDMDTPPPSVPVEEVATERITDAGDETSGDGLPPTQAESDLMARIRALPQSGRGAALRDFEASQQEMRNLLLAQDARIAAGEQRVADEYAHSMDTYNKQREALALQQRNNAAARQEAMRDIQTVEKDISDFKIDPNRAFPSLAGQILAAVSVAVGAFAQASSGGRIPNTALNIIMSAINRDIDAQKQEFQTKKTVLANRNNLFAQLVNTHNNEEKASQLAMNGALHFANMRIQQISNTLAGQKSKQMIQRLLAQVNQEGVKLKLQNIERQQKDKATALSLELQATKGQGRGQDRSNLGRQTELLKRAKKTTQDLIKFSLEASEADKGERFATLQRYAAETLNPINRFIGQKIAKPEHKKLINGNVFLAQGTMKAFQGGNPSNQDARTFVQIVPSIALDHPERVTGYQAILAFIDEETQGGRVAIQPGRLFEAAKAQRFGEFNPDSVYDVNAEDLGKFKDVIGFTTVEDVAR